MAISKVFVTRATGTQGSAVSRHLRKQGIAVNALVRDPADERAAALKDIGVSLYEGSLDDQDAVERTVAGCDGLFLVLMPNLAEEGSEPRQAKLLLGAAKSAGVHHVVASTSMGAGKMKVPGQDGESSLFQRTIEGKYNVEEQVRNGGFDTWTVLRPAYFMNNFFWPLNTFMFPELASEGKFVSSYEPTTILPLIDPNDIGAFGAAAFVDPKKFAGQNIEFAGEKLTVEQVVPMLADAAGKDIKAVYRTLEESMALAGKNPIIAAQLSMLEMHKLIDLEKVNGYGIKMGTLKDFLQREHRLVQQTFDPSNKEGLKLF
ncbi:NAD(P)-binding protein [Rhizodiscina lignyota]|uniref:NAD(P)-binding protein n=1 Tax=Rhizodiscina lignyota TaxID=1504668 RepID=A0A9P4M261_9PEZI|nr:NAD(P)-binding protein [Rhizodiscina lignyota]